MREVYLYVVTGRGDVAIPFQGLKNLDEFTLGFQNQADFITRLSRIFRGKIDVSSVSDLYILISTYVKNKDGSYGEINSKLPVRYLVDDYDRDKLGEVVVKYLIDNPSKVENQPFKHMFGNIDFSNGVDTLIARKKMLDISNAIIQANYSLARSIYFILSYAGYTVPVRARMLEDDNRKITDFESNDDYFANLIHQVVINPERYSDVMEEIAGHDLEELEKAFTGNKNGIVDGAPIYEKTVSKDFRDLQKYSGLSEDEVVEIIKRYNKGTRGK